MSSVIFAMVCSAINIHLATIATGVGHRRFQKALVIVVAIATARTIVRAFDL